MVALAAIKQSRTRRAVYRTQIVSEVEKVTISAIVYKGCELAPTVELGRTP